MSDAPVTPENEVVEPDPSERDRILRRRRRIGFVLLGAGGLIVLTAAWVVVTGLIARSQLQSVRTEVHQLRDQLTSGDLTAARTTLAALQTHAHRAHWLTTGPAWALAAALPDGGEPLRTIRGITASADDLAVEGAAHPDRRAQAARPEHAAPGRRHDRSGRDLGRARRRSTGPAR